MYNKSITKMQRARKLSYFQYFWTEGLLLSFAKMYNKKFLKKTIVKLFFLCYTKYSLIFLLTFFMFFVTEGISNQIFSEFRLKKRISLYADSFCFSKLDCFFISNISNNFIDFGFINPIFSVSY